MIGEQGCSADEIRARLALLQCSGVGPLTYLALLNSFHSAQAVLTADYGSLRAEQCSESLTQIILKASLSDADPVLQQLDACQATLLLHDQPDYPKILGAVTDLPPVLFVKGDAALLNQTQLAIVGSRKATKASRDITLTIARELSEAGVLITSGMALGIDASAHQGAIDAGKPTIAVMGTGIDQIYPKRHQALSEQILAGGGVLLSEFFPGSKPFPANFPKRNRIISGMSHGMLVAEATVKSGSLITAAHALDQGREVMALPGPAWNPAFAGNNHLIQQGAQLVLDARDILHSMEWMQGEVVDNAANDRGAAVEQILAEEESKVLKCLTDQASPIDQIIELCGLTAGVVSSILLTLELRGLVIATPGGFCRSPASYF